jgi:hypothetical protein
VSEAKQSKANQTLIDISHEIKDVKQNIFIV